MEKQIWKYFLEVQEKQTVLMPTGAEILCVQIQDDGACIWALVNPKSEMEERHFETFGTGHPVYCDMGIDRKYIGTYQLGQGITGTLVFHVFERIN